MDFRNILNKIDLLESLILAEDLRLKNIITQIAGQEGNDKERFAKLRQLANDEKLPGLYDPVTGKYITVAGGVENTAPKEDDKRLAYMGLIPDNAATSTFWGRIFGTSGKDYDTELRTQSKTAIASQDRAELEQEELAELKRLMPKYIELKKKTARARRARQAAAQSNSGQGGQAAGRKNPDKFVTTKLSNGWEWREYGDGTVYIYNPAQSRDYAASAVDGQPGIMTVGSIYLPPKLPPGVTKLKEAIEFKSNLASILVGLHKADKLTEDTNFDLAPDLVGYLTAMGYGGVVGTALEKNPALVKKILFGTLPGMAAGYAAYDTYIRCREGDWVGAGISGLSMAVSFIPYFGLWGVVGGFSLDMVNIRRDMNNNTARIKNMQGLLGVPATGTIDEKTKAALIDYQKKNKLNPSGELDSATAKFAGIPERVLKEEEQKNTEVEKYPPIFFYKEGNAYIMLPNGGLFDEQGNQLDPKTLDIVAKNVLGKLKPEELLSNYVDLKEETAGTVIGKQAIPWGERFLNWLSKFKPQAAAKEAEGIATGKIITGNVPRNAGDIVTSGGKEYTWTGSMWAEKLPNGTLKNAPEEVQVALEKAIKNKELGIDTTKIPPNKRDPLNKDDLKPDANVVKPDPNAAERAAVAAKKAKEAEDAAKAAKTAEDRAAKEALAKQAKAEADAAAKEVKAAEKTTTATKDVAAGEKVADTAVNVANVAKPGIWAKVGDAFKNGKLGKWLGIAITGGALIYGTEEYRKWKQEHPKEPDPEGTDYNDGTVADGNGGKKPKPNTSTTNSASTDDKNDGTSNGKKDGTSVTSDGKKDNGIAGQAATTPEEEDDLEEWDKIQKRVNDLVNDLNKTTNPAIRKELYVIKDSL